MTNEEIRLQVTRVTALEKDIIVLTEILEDKDHWTNVRDSLIRRRSHAICLVGPILDRMKDATRALLAERTEEFQNCFAPSPTISGAATDDAMEGLRTTLDGHKGDVVPYYPPLSR